MAEGKFREDLFYRLSVVPLTVPPLRDRRNDVPLLARHFLARIARDAGREGLAFSDAAMDFMLSYPWPGNVRELQNWIQFALIKCKGPVVQLEHLPPMVLQVVQRPSQRSVPTPETKRRKLTIEIVQAALSKTSGNKVEAARELGVSRATLYRFLDGKG
jgi:sigma-54 dependent transcriptional regulator, acetoin dehydrogenase operon transcriptional activator AcoR